MVATAQRRAPAAEERLDRVIESAAYLAQGAGRGVSVVRHWLETEAFETHPYTMLGIAFGLGVFTGWLIKRR
jgi:hypothetical protein